MRTRTSRCPNHRNGRRRPRHLRRICQNLAQRIRTRLPRKRTPHHPQFLHHDPHDNTLQQHHPRRQPSNHRQNHRQMPRHLHHPPPHRPRTIPTHPRPRHPPRNGPRKVHRIHRQTSLQRTLHERQRPESPTGHADYQRVLRVAGCERGQAVYGHCGWGERGVFRVGEGERASIDSYGGCVGEAGGVSAGGFSGEVYLEEVSSEAGDDSGVAG
mmetsp:Transcript_21358/g.38645  ORF Transcript_21358/g.38645 Transcript_21358/m.38645 type:complete len:213 (-) Transcript_21358:406-1044(-)